MQQPSPLLPREKMIAFGAEQLSNVELIALILGNGTKQTSVFDLALKADTVIAQLNSYLTNQVNRLPGLGVTQTCRLLAAKEWGRRLAQPPQRQLIFTAEQVVTCVQEIRNEKKEYLIGLYLNGRQELVAKEIITIGSLNKNSLVARDVFAPAMNLPAAYVILVHNHPSGNPGASRADISTTKQLLAAGDILGITILDHIIVTANEFSSLRELGFF